MQEEKKEQKVSLLDKIFWGIMKPIIFALIIGTIVYIATTIVNRLSESKLERCQRECEYYPKATSHKPGAGTCYGACIKRQ
jgi:hypothetical protein